MIMRNIRTAVVMAASVLIGNGIDLRGGRQAYAQSAAPSGAEVKASARTIEEVRGLVAELDAHAERQRLQLQMIEASLRRARDLLDALEAGQGNPPHGNVQRNSFRSPEERRNLPDQETADLKEWRWSDIRATPQATRDSLGTRTRCKSSRRRECPGR